MKRSSHTVAVCGITAALSIVLMALGSALGIMTYACPILVGILLLCVREELGCRWALTLWAAIGLLAVMLVPELEMTATFIGIFGWYPAVQPALNKLPKLLRPMCKLVALNAGAVLSYALLMKVTGLEDMPNTLWAWVLLLVMANLVFLLYDLALTRLRVTMVPRMRRLFGGR